MRHGLILAGGGGTRLWPASRRARPKQFLALGTRPGESLLAAAARRLGAIATPWVVTAAGQADLVAAELPSLGDHLVAEPIGRNTAAAIGLAAVMVRRRDPTAVLGVFPADHAIVDEVGFAAAATRGFAVAEQHDAIVTIGITPSRPETGFGYLELGAAGAEATEVVRFVEKPDAERAAAMARDGRHLWNAGIFFFSARRILAEIERHLPALGQILAEVAAAEDDAAAARVIAARYPAAPAISIDHGVMERTAGILTIPADVGWSDVGSWDALAALRPRDADGNVFDGMALAVDASDNVLVADPGKLIAVVGVTGLVVVQAGDAVLVVPRARAQEVREVLARLGVTAGLAQFL